MTGRELVKQLEKLGWELDRQKGSHAVFMHLERPGRLVVTIKYLFI